MTGSRWQCIYQKKQMLAGFPHFYFNANREMAVHYLKHAESIAIICSPSNENKKNTKLEMRNMKWQI